MFALVLNPMTANAERSNYVARADTKEALERFVESERVEPYMDGPWGKCFRKGGPLEWFNGPDMTWEGGAYLQVISRQDAMERAGIHWDAEIGTLPILT